MKLALAAMALGAFNLGIALDHGLFVTPGDGTLIVGISGFMAFAAGAASAWLELAFIRADAERRAMGPRRDARGRFTTPNTNPFL